MPAVRGGRDSKGNIKPIDEEVGYKPRVERFRSHNNAKIGHMKSNLVTENGKQRVGKKNATVKAAMKKWRLKSPFRRWRISNNFTIQEAADVLGVPNITYQQWEYGRYRINQTVTVQGVRSRFNEKLSPICGFTRAIHNKWMDKKPRPEVKAKTIKGADDA